MDREKVIKGLENCITGFDCPPECPYLDDCNDLMKPMFVELAKDALALLKEQEAKTGHWIEDETETYTENHDTWECSECHEPFTLTEGTPEENKFYFCPRCGAKMEFEGR